MTEVKQTKELNFQDMKETVSKYDEWVEFQLGEDTHLTFKPYFKNTELTEMVSEMNELELEQIPDTLMWSFMLFQLIKKFTGLKDQLTGETLQEQLQEMNVIIDAEFEGKSLFKIITEDLFLIEEINKVQDMLHEGLATANLMKQITEKGLMQLDTLQIANEEIKNIKLGK